MLWFGTKFLVEYKAPTGWAVLADQHLLIFGLGPKGLSPHSV